jgi:hypothetical protein
MCRCDLSCRAQLASTKGPTGNAEADALCLKLGTAMAEAKKEGGTAAQAAAWDREWESVYALAKSVMLADEAAVLARIDSGDATPAVQLK